MFKEMIFLSRLNKVSLKCRLNSDSMMKKKKKDWIPVSYAQCVRIISAVKHRVKYVAVWIQSCVDFDYN